MRIATLLQRLAQVDLRQPAQYTPRESPCSNAILNWVELGGPTCSRDDFGGIPNAVPVAYFRLVLCLVSLLVAAHCTTLAQ